MKSGLLRFSVSFLSACIFLNISGRFVLYAEDTKNKAIEQFDFANGLFGRDLFVMAIQEYEKFLQQYPGHEKSADAYFSIAESYFLAYKYKESIDAFNKFIEAYPNDGKVPIAKVRLGQSQYSEGNSDAAIEMLKSVASDSLNTEFKQLKEFFLAKSYQKKADRGSTIQHYQNVFAADPATIYAVNAYLALGDFFFEEKDYSNAMHYFGKAHEFGLNDNHKSVALNKKGESLFLQHNYEQSKDVFHSVVNQFPNEIIAETAMINLLLSFEKLKQHSQLIDMFLRYKDMVKSRDSLFEIYYISTEAYAQSERFDDALAQIQAVQKWEAISEGHLHRTKLKQMEVLLKAGRAAEVLTVFADDASASTDKDYIYFLKAEAFYNLKEYAHSYEFYKKIIDESPDSRFFDDAMYGMAYAKNGLKEFDQAAALYDDYFQKGKDAEKKKESLFNQILILRDLGQLDKAIEKAKLYVQTYNEKVYRPEVLFVLGTAYSDQEKYQDAAAVFTQLLNEFPDFKNIDEARFLLAFGMQKLGEKDKAVELYRSVNNQNKDLAYASLKNMALIYINDNKFEEAGKVFDQIIVAFPENDLQADTYLWLAEEYDRAHNYDGINRILKDADAKFNNTEKSSGLTYFRAQAAAGKQEFDSAVALYDAILSSTDKGLYYGLSLIGKAVCYKEKKEFDKAKELLNQAILEYTNDISITLKARFELANIENLMGRPDEATKFYMLVAVLYNDSYYCPEALYKAGEIFESLKKKEDALKVYTEISELYKDSHRFNQALERIKVLNES